MKPLALAAALLICGTGAAPAPPFTVTELTTLRGAYSITFLPSGPMLVTGTDGRLTLVSNGGRTQVQVQGAPTIARNGQGALIDIALHPDFARNHRIYLTYSEAKGTTVRGLALASAELFAEGAFPSLGEFKVLYRAEPYIDTTIQYGGRLAFGPDGHLFMTIGERNKPETAQDPKQPLGKILRFRDDGTPAPDPALAKRGFAPGTWSYGHRNPLGLAFDAQGNLWETEMGPKGGDELNLVQPGRNYGWPLASNGDDYNDKPIPDHRAGDGFDAPKAYWTPSISPAGLMIYSGKLWPEWKGSMFVGALSGEALVRLTVNGTAVTKADQWPMAMRVREVVEAPDGSILIIEDRKGRLLRLDPAR